MAKKPAHGVAIIIAPAKAVKGAVKGKDKALPRQGKMPMKGRTPTKGKAGKAC